MMGPPSCSRVPADRHGPSERIAAKRADDHGVLGGQMGKFTRVIRAAVLDKFRVTILGPKTDLSWMFRDLQEGRYLLRRSELHFHARCGG